MISEISRHLKEKINSFTGDDSLIYNSKIIKINKNNFETIPEIPENKSIAFIDGGQAEIVSAGNFCVSFIRVAAVIFQNNKKISGCKKEFYLLTTARYVNDNLINGNLANGDLIYESKMFCSNSGDKLVAEKDLLISSTDPTIKAGIERAPISKISSMARRFAELSMASQVASGAASQTEADFVVIDGTLEQTYKNEEIYLGRLNAKVCSLAKSSSLFTVSGNSPAVLLNKLGLSGCWRYFVDKNGAEQNYFNYFVKLHEKAKHVFRFMGDKEALPYLAGNSSDALFLGYPYGLIAADKLARISNEEKNSLRMNFLLRSENKEIAEYLNTANVHEILDRMG